MKRKFSALLLIFSLVATLLAVPAYALQDPIILTIDSVVYGEGQNTLIAKGAFVNTSNKSVLRITDVQLEITKGSTIIASKEFNIIAQKELNIAIGDGVKWEFVLENPVKGMDLTGFQATSKVVYNQGSPLDLAAGKKVYYKGAAIDFDVKPAVINGRLMIPARAVFEKMGAIITWNDASKSLDVSRNNRRVTIFINNPNMVVDGTPVKLDVPATIINGRTLVPLRAITTALGAGITYGELNEMAVIYE